MPGAVLIIAADNLLPRLRDRVVQDGADEQILEFPDTEPIQALQAILQSRPPLIVLERLFAATPRGAALINRIKSDPQLGGCEVKVMSHTGDYVRQVVKPSKAATPVLAVGGDEVEAAAPAAPAAAPPRPLDWHGTRRAPRHRVRTGVEMQLDGNPATVIDLSAVGAQVVSPTVLRPNQKVRINLPSDEFVMRFRGAVAWAKFELPRNESPAPQYRAGIEFADSDADALEHFCRKHKQ
jgi:hypothetical protein